MMTKTKSSTIGENNEMLECQRPKRQGPKRQSPECQRPKRQGPKRQSPARQSPKVSPKNTNLLHGSPAKNNIYVIVFQHK